MQLKKIEEIVANKLKMHFEGAASAEIQQEQNNILQGSEPPQEENPFAVVEQAEEELPASVF